MRLADLITSKVVWNSTISTRGAKYACVAIKSFYLNTPIDRYEYMKMPIKLFPQYIIDKYNLMEHVQNRFVYLEIRMAIYRLVHVWILTNKLLKNILKS